MHHIHHTDAFILSSRPSGEDSKTFTLYTRELGLVHARAQAVRKISSKLRYTLQDFSRASVDLVRGKEVWRITTASPVDSAKEIRIDAETERVLARIASRIARFAPGEEPNDEIFDALVDLYAMLGEERSDDDLSTIELYIAARLFVSLGYISRDAISIGADSRAVPHALSDETFRKQLISDINRALESSHL